MATGCFVIDRKLPVHLCVLKGNAALPAHAAESEPRRRALSARRDVAGRRDVAEGRAAVGDAAEIEDVQHSHVAAIAAVMITRHSRTPVFVLNVCRPSLPGRVGTRSVPRI